MTSYPSPRNYLTKIAAAVSKRCGIHQATVEQVLPAFIDELRYRIIEDPYHCVPIESFGTFGIKNLPARQHMYGYNEAERKLRILPPKDMLKFYPTRNMRREVEAGKVDWSRKSFHRHPQDPVIRKRAAMIYRADRSGKMGKGQTTYFKPSTPEGEDEEARKNTQS